MNNVIPSSNIRIDNTTLEWECLLASKEETSFPSQQEIDECYQEYSAMEAKESCLYSD